MYFYRIITPGLLLRLGPGFGPGLLLALGPGLWSEFGPGLLPGFSPGLFGPAVAPGLFS